MKSWNKFGLLMWKFKLRKITQSVKPVEGSKMKSWDKFCLLMWKNWKLQLRQPIRTLIEICVPLLALVACILLRCNVEKVNYPATSDQPDKIFQPFNAKKLQAYSPNNSEDLNKIMGVFQLKGFPNGKALEDYFANQETNYIPECLGIQFDDNLPDKLSEFPETLTVKLRCTGDDYWKTKSLYPGFSISYGNRPSLGALPSHEIYQESGFSSIMYGIANALNVAYNQTKLEQMYYKPFPYPSFTEDQVIEAMGSFILFGILFMTAFTFVCSTTVKSITFEKEKQLKESMKIMGLPTWLHWTAWFFHTFVPLLVVIICFVIGLKYDTANGPVFTYSNWLLIFLFFLFYIVDLIMFCFALSGFFSKANRAASITGIIWIISSVPFIIIRSGSDYTDTSSSLKYFSSLLPVSASFYGFDLLCLYESRETGVQWSNMFETTIQNNISFGGILFMMFLNIFVYLGIALYIEQVYPGEFGVPQKWNFLFTAEYWRSNNKTSDDNDSMFNKRNEYFEDEPTDLKAGIKIKNLIKNFGPNEVVKGVSFNLYEDQITVLLGHNGAGKTTTMSMLTGMFPPTNGTAYVNNYDVRTQIMKVRDSMGFCPQHNVLFDSLTVREHLQFFSKLKGCKGREVDLEIKKFLDLLDLQDKIDCKSNELSGGMKRKLSVGIALCGNSKVIMLDEPTAGMDPSARRFIWEFLQKMKKGRTILLTTHFMDEADLLGDRIAIMSSGELKCCGSSFFLKKKYGTGYHLIVDELPHCQPDKITNLLRKYIPDIHIKSRAGTETLYLLPEVYSEKFPQMLTDIEDNSNNLGIRSFGISLTTLEEVFMKVGTNETGKTIIRSNNDTNVTIEDSTTLITGFELYKNQIHAMAYKKMLSTIRTWGIELMKIVLPILYLLLVIIPTQNAPTVKNSLSRDFKLEDYNNPITFVENSPKMGNYITMLEQHNYKFNKTDNMTKTILSVTESDPLNIKYKYIVGASFNAKIQAPVAWFDSEDQHSYPLSLQLLLNTYFDKPEKGVQQFNFVNYPLPKRQTDEEKQQQQLVGTNKGILTLALCAAFVSSFFILFNIRERVTQAKHLQFVSGINVFIFWFTAFICDIITFAVPIICLFIAIAILQIDGLTSLHNLILLALVFFDFIIAILPFLYVCSFFYAVPSTGYSTMFFLCYALGFPASNIILILDLYKWEYTSLLRWIFRFVPGYDLSESISNIMKGHKTCDLPFCPSNYTQAECVKMFCEKYPKADCCLNNSIFNFTNEGIGIGIAMSYLVMIVAFTLVFLTDFKIFANLRYKLFSKNVFPTKPSFTDEDVENENNFVSHTPISQLQSQFILILKDLTKYYTKFPWTCRPKKPFVAVNGLNLTVKKSECFGLLGVNGAGKTTTFKMMTGDEMISYGDGWTGGNSIKTQIKEVQKMIGYCPQFDALLDDLTARETIKIFSLIRGVPKDECNFIAEKLARDFDFTEHLDKKVKELSGGNKRKLSTSIALIGDSPVLFLDEPTTGMDPATKRHLWNQLSEIRETGKSIILTSHSMEECEALCTRLAIMVNGNFQCLGSIQHLKSRFAEGFSVKIKIKKLDDSSGLQHADTTNIEIFMATEFPNSELKEKHQELLSYYIKEKNVKWSRLFGILERAKKELNIEDYSIGQASLEQVFLTFTKNQIGYED